MNSDRLSRLQSMLSEDPKDSFLRYALAQEYVKLEQYDLAIETYESLRSDDPNYVGLYYHLAGLYADLEEKEKAEETYNAGITVAQQVGDRHALSELMNAKTNFEIEF